MSFRRPKRPPSPRERARPRRDPEPTPLPMAYALLAAVALWMVMLLSQAALADAATSRIAAPRQASPADGAAVQAVPSFSWKAVRGAAKYEFQLAADPAFKSIVGGAGNGSYFTRNTFASVTEALADGGYHWRVRAVDGRSRTGRWSPVREIRKRWTAVPAQLSPPDGGSVTYPRTPLVLRWEPVPGAYKYLLRIATDPGLANSALGDRLPAVETSGTVFALPGALAPGRYYWAVTPLDGRKHPGTRSAVSSFQWAWPTGTATRVTDIDPDPHVMDPRFAWDAVAGAAQYQIEISFSQDFALGSRVCCDEQVVGTTHSPLRLLPHNTYYWRVRAVDVDGNAGDWNVGPSFQQVFDPRVGALRIRDNTADRTPAAGPSGLPTTGAPVVAWDPVPGASSYEVTVAPWGVVAPTNVRATASESGGSLAAGTYHYAVTALDGGGETHGSAEVSASVTGTTGSVALAWTAVPGAAGYRIYRGTMPGGQNTFYTSATASFKDIGAVPANGSPPRTSSGFSCDWTASQFGEPTARTMTTATPAWTPLGPITNVRPVGNAFTSVSNDFGWKLWKDTSYCLRVRARRDRETGLKEIVSGWTQLGGEDRAGFTYAQRPAGTCAPARTPAGAYREPQTGALSPRTPLFTWDWVPGACGYFVVVARDAEFTKIIDVALTPHPAYAPRSGYGPTTYADETTAYYWAVMPSTAADGQGLSSNPTQNSPQAFHRRSTPPSLLSPAPGGDVVAQPEFRWSAVEGARQYRVQVDDDPTFGSPIADVVTNATGHTSVNALPADSLLYWRVRANDENLVGLTWSATGTFRRRLPVPAVGENPSGGEEIPVLSWSPVEGAVSYDMHVEQVDGTKRDFTMRATAFTPVIFYGTGIWHWQVRANFRAGHKTVSGGYSAAQPYTRRIATPAGVRTTKAGRSALMSWDAARMAKGYRVQVATTDSFSTIVEQAITDNTSWAPRMTNPAFDGATGLYWRVAAVDEGNNAGGWATSPLRSAQQARMRVRGTLRKGRTGRLRVTVTGRRRRALRGAVVRVQGAGVVTTPRRTNRRGLVVLRVKPTSGGIVRLSADKTGYAPARARVKVR